MFVDMVNSVDVTLLVEVSPKTWDILTPPFGLSENPAHRSLIMFKDEIVADAIIEILFNQVFLEDSRKQTLQFFTGQCAYGVEFPKRIGGNSIPFLTAHGFSDIERIVYAAMRFKHNMPLVRHDIPN